MMAALSDRWVRQLEATERRRWRLAVELSRESAFTPEQCRRLLFACSDDYAATRGLVQRATRRACSMMEAWRIMAALAHRRPAEG
jgi:hypothetical protein